MAFSFDPALTDPLDRVRQLVGDTVDAGHLVEDATITYYLGLKGELAVAAQLAADLMARFASAIDAETDQQHYMRSQRFKQYKELAIRLEAQLAASGNISGGDTQSDTEFAGVGAFGTTSLEVIQARHDPFSATNAPIKFFDPFGVSGWTGGRR